MSAVDCPSTVVDEAKTVAEAVSTEFRAIAIEREPLIVHGTANLPMAPLWVRAFSQQAWPLALLPIRRYDFLFGVPGPDDESVSAFGHIIGE
jgi:hypothetical protein